jgi:hypothetical protein
MVRRIAGASTRRTRSLRREVAEKRALGDSGALGNLGRGGAVDAALTEEIDGGRQNIALLLGGGQEPVGLMLDIGKRQAFLFRHSVAVFPNSISAVSSFTSLETAGIVRTIHSERQASEVRHCCGHHHRT